MIRLALGLWLATAFPAFAETVRLATFHTELSQRGPGLLLDKLVKGEDPRVAAVTAMIAEIDPDILVLQDIDYDAGAAALTALADTLAKMGLDYPERFALPPNSGVTTGLDLDGDGLRGGPRDAQGYGNFIGDGGMAILSRLPIDKGAVSDLSGLLWSEMPGAIPPSMPAEVTEVRRLSSVAHWVVPVQIGKTTLNLMTWHATPPVFDGPEDTNGRRNHDETALWLKLLDGALALPPPAAPFVILGVGNVDPQKGEGLTDAIRTLLDDPRVQEPEAIADVDTAMFAEPLGPLRVSYLLPSADLRVVRAGVFDPPFDTPQAQRFGPAEHWSRHRILWADIATE